MIIDPFVFDIIKTYNNSDVSFIQSELKKMGIEAELEDVVSSVRTVCEAVMVKENEEDGEFSNTVHHAY